MIAFYEEQLNGHATVEREFRRSGADGHTLLHGRGACGDKAIAAGELNDTDATCANCGEAVEVAESGNALAVNSGRVENGLAFRDCDQLAIDSHRNCFFRHDILLDVG